MGRGAGNLKTELLLTYLSLKKNLLKINNFKNIGNVVDQFEEIKLREKWGRHRLLNLGDQCAELHVFIRKKLGSVAQLESYALIREN